MLTIVILVTSSSATNPRMPALELHPRTMLRGPGNTAMGLSCFCWETEALGAPGSATSLSYFPELSGLWKDMAAV